MYRTIVRKAPGLVLLFAALYPDGGQAQNFSSSVSTGSYLYEFYESSSSMWSIGSDYSISYSYDFLSNTNITLYLYNEHPSMTMFMHTWESDAFSGSYEYVEDLNIPPGEFVMGKFADKGICSRMFFDGTIGPGTINDITMENFWYLCGSIQSANEFVSTFSFVDQSGTWLCTYTSSLDAYEDDHGIINGEGMFTIGCEAFEDNSSYSYSFSLTLEDDYSYPYDISYDFYEGLTDFV